MKKWRGRAAVTLVCVWMVATGVPGAGAELVRGSSQPGGGPPTWMASLDLNGDGHDDVIETSDKYLSVFAGDGAGALPALAGGGTTASGSVYDADLLDANEDGNADVALAGAAGVELATGDGTGRFSIGSPLIVASNAASVAAGDFNEDGHDDLAVATGMSVVLLHGDGSGGFSASPASPLGFASAVRRVRVLDAGGDGHDDLAVLTDDSKITVEQGSGTGAFTAKAPVALTYAIPFLKVVDLNDDGHDDLVVYTGQGRMAQLLGTGSGTVAAPIEATMAGEPLGDVDFADFNGDGFVDAAATVQDSTVGTVVIALGDGTGALRTSNNFGSLNELPRGSTGLAVGDFDEDGAPDVAVNSSYGSLDVGLDRPFVDVAVSAPTSPTPEGTPVTLTAVVTNRGGRGTPTGVIDVYEGATLVASGYWYSFVEGTSATFQVYGLSLPAGAHNLVARYRGSDMYAPALSAPFIVTVRKKQGYWMLGAAGPVYGFGDAAVNGWSFMTPGVTAVDIEPTPAGDGYWIVDDQGTVHPYSAPWFGDAGPLAVGERVSAISSTPSGQGYWLFTTRGRAIARGNARWLGDMSSVPLNGPVRASVVTPSGNGYYMIASDGGIFCYGDAVFQGSMALAHLNGPVVGLAPDPDGVGYWLVGSDGGIFAFQAGFMGSMGGRPLNKPIVGALARGNGYIMVASDGGIFNFSDADFLGSLSGSPPAWPITSVALLPS